MERRKPVPQFTPIPHGGSNGTIPKGWGGTRSLPASFGKTGFQTTWILPEHLRALFMERGIISVVIETGPAGEVQSMSVAVPEVRLTGQH